MNDARDPALARVTVLCGGLGGARLTPWLDARCDLTVVVNVADDLDFMGLRVCPDIDAVLYALGGTFDGARGYGVRGDTFGLMDLARRSGLESWFGVGDRDLLTHVVRTAALREGRSLGEVTALLAASGGVRARVLPATDDMVRTRVLTAQGERSFQEFFVRDRALVAATGVTWAGLEQASPAPGVIAALKEADLVVIAESSPVASILPILGLPGVRSALARCRGARVALSPIVASVPPASEADRHHARAREVLMAALGLAHEPAAVAALYEGLVDLFVLDVADEAHAGEVLPRVPGVRCVELLSRDEPERTRLAELLVSLARGAPLAAV